METFTVVVAGYAEFIALVFAIIGAVIISFGSIVALIHFLKGFFEKHQPSDKFAEVHIDTVRVEYGRYINLGLEFFIAKDVLETIFVPTWTQIGQLFALVVIRTIISYFLMHEIEKIEDNNKE